VSDEPDLPPDFGNDAISRAMRGPCPELIHWLNDKLAEAEKALKWREDEARTWRTGTNAQWASAAAMHPSTAGKSLGKAARLVEADRHARIAVKMRREVQMFQDTLTALGH
jgi:hypothetical protein